jgi:hypothetical protein
LAKREDQVGNMKRRGSVYTLRLPTTPTVEHGSTLEGSRPLSAAQRSNSPTVEPHAVRPLSAAQPKLEEKEEKPLKLEGGERHRDAKREGKGNGQGHPAWQEECRAWAAARNLPQRSGEPDFDYLLRIASARREGAGRA